MAGLRTDSKSNRAGAGRVGVLVLGMHRSGTSALTRVLSLLGCDLPKTLIKPDPSNEAGHWESLPIARLDDEILDSAGSKWWDWLDFNPGWHTSPKAEEFKERALATLEEEFGRSCLFVLKDPRICRFAPFWLDVLQTAGVRPVVIMPVRHPLEVAESLSRRNGFDPALGQLLWLRNVLEAEVGTRGAPRFYTSYGALVDGWPRVASAAQEALGVSWPRLSVLTSEEIDAFLTNRLRHHNQSPESVSDNPLVSAWLRDVFAIFSRWAADGETSEDHSPLDRIRAELDAATPAFSRLISVGKYSAEKAKALEVSLKETEDKLAEAEAAAAAKFQQVEALERSMEETSADLLEIRGAAEQKQREMAEVVSRLSEAQSELTSLRAEVQSHRTALEEARGELSHLQSELAQRRAEADDATSHLQLAEQRHTEELRAQRERHAEELESERRRASGEIDKLREERRAAEGRLAERFGEIAVMTRMLGEKETAAQRSDERSAWLREVSAVLLNGSGSKSVKGRLAALVPGPMRLNRQKARLKRTGIFDPDGYLAANPDVAEAGMDPLWHYINHGIEENRPLHAAESSRDHKTDQ